MAQNLTNYWRRIPQRVDVMTTLSPQGDVAEVYTFNPAFERLSERNLNAFRKPQINSSPAIINTNEWIGGTISAPTQQQIRESRMAEAKTKIVNALGGLIKWWQLATKAWQQWAKTLIDLYNKIK